MLANALQELRSAKQQLVAKISGLITEAKTIDQAIEALSGLSVGNIPAPVAPGKRTMSAAGRKAIAAGARARWAKYKKAKSATPAKKKRTMSAAAKAKLSAFQKERWAKINAAKAAAQ